MAKQIVTVDLPGILLPRICNGCGLKLLGNEKAICSSCFMQMPETDYHNFRENPVERLFYGRVPIEMAASFVFFEKGTAVQRLLKHLKYHGAQEVGKAIGKRYGVQLAHSRFSAVDAITCVPLHRKKKQKRGYNQCHAFGQALASAMNKPWYSQVIKRQAHTKTQTAKGREQRWKTMQKAFDIGRDAEQVQQKHVLLIDDVVTTGATLEACATVLLNHGIAQVSIVTIACA